MRSPRPRRSRLSLAVLLLAAAVAIQGAGCEPRVEEPLPPARSESPSSAAATSAKASTAGQNPAKPRCIKPTPDKPARSVPPGPNPACPPDDLAEPPKLRTASVVFPDAGGREVSVEIVDTEKNKARGLMYRKEMPENHGMIFLFDQRKNHTFWMHNTCISLDMIFIDDDGVIVGIEENTPTLDDSTFHVGCPSRNVLEVNAGFTRKHGIKAGQRVEYRGI
jgi:hypothetical protein